MLKNTLLLFVIFLSQFSVALRFSGEHALELVEIFDVSFSDIEISAELDSPKSQAMLGMFYREGIGTLVDEGAANKWFKKSAKGLFLEAENGDPEAQFLLSFLCDEGVAVFGSKTDADQWRKMASSRFLRLAEQGNARAQYSLGVMYADSLGSRFGVSGLESLKWYEKAANQGVVNAQCRMGYAYRVGNLGVEINLDTSIEWYQKAADQGSVSALIEIGTIYLSEDKMDLSKAGEYYERAAQIGDASTLFMIGYAYSYSQFMRDISFPVEAARWYKKAAEQGSAKAQFRQGCNLLPDSPEEAERWFLKAAATDALHQRYFAEMYHYGERYILDRARDEFEKYKFLRVDLKEAARWYLKAAEQGDKEAQLRIGWMYFSGKGVSKNYEEALQWFKKASERGEGEASARVGWMYWRGHGVPVDEVQTLFWYRKAAKQGDFEAKSHLENYEASKKYVDAAKAGDADAQYEFGISLLGGFFPFRKNIPEGAIWLYRAKDQGHMEAEKDLSFQAKYYYRLTRNIESNKRAEEAHGFYQKGRDCEAEDRKKERDWERKKEDAGRYFEDMRPFKFDSVARAKAAEFYLIAAKLGSPKGQYEIASKYSKGEGVRKNLKESAKWHLEAAMQGYSRSQSALAEIYEEGFGVVEDYIDAYSWASVFSTDPVYGSKYRKDKLKRSMTPSQLAEGQARAKAILAEIERKQALAQLPISESMIENSISPSGYGSGLLIKGGYVLTCWHVVAESQRILVSVEGKDYAAQVIRKDLANDIAVLQVDGVSNGTQIRLASDPKLGEQIFTLGYPHPDLQGADVKFTMGTISGMTGPGETPNYYQVSAPVQSGNSGGPLFDQHGNLVGIVAAKLDSLATLALTGDLPQNVNYVINADYLRPLLKTVSELEIEPVNIEESNLLELIEELKKSAVLIKVY